MTDHTPSVQLSLEDAGVTDVWLRVKLTDSNPPRNYALQRNGATILSGTLTTNDTLLVDTITLPKWTYTYKALRLENTTRKDSSEPLQVTTMDTTSHSFTWQTFTFGGEPGTGSSLLYDVAIINDTLVYAVGEITLKDSTGRVDPQSYAIAKWNGKQWELIKIFNTKNQLIPTVRGVFIFSSSDIWLADGGVHHWDGVSRQVSASFDRISLIGGFENGQSVNKLWGRSSNDLYGVGYNGMMAHYNGTTWTKLESGTMATINDIWGAVNPITGERTILCAVSEYLAVGDRRILSITSQNKVDSISWSPQREVRSVWFPTQSRIFTAGEGIFVRNHSQEWREYTETPRIYSDKIRGISYNDLFVVGGFGLVLHYNGSTWKYFDQFYGNYILSSISYKNNFAIAVGSSEREAIIIQMRRN